MAGLIWAVYLLWDWTDGEDFFIWDILYEQRTGECGDQIIWDFHDNILHELKHQINGNAKSSKKKFMQVNGTGR